MGMPTPGKRGNRTSGSAQEDLSGYPTNQELRNRSDVTFNVRNTSSVAKSNL